MNKVNGIEVLQDIYKKNAPAFADDYLKYKQLGELNPFRYRGYYYDIETSLYYLQTRYYDPEVGRFISQDSIEYADPETINGLNLYAYCGNNPVMNVDPTGTLFWLIFAGVLLAGLFSGVSSVINASEDENKWGAFLGGFVSGVIGGVGLAAAVATGGLGGAILALGSGFLGGFVGDLISQSISYGSVDFSQAICSGAINSLINITTYVGFNCLGIFNEPTWLKRFASVISPSVITSAISIYFMSLPIPIFKRNNLINDVKKKV